MPRIKKILILPILIWGLFSLTNAYLFGMKSFDNSIENILQIEQKYWIYLPIVSFIYDPREQQDVPALLKEMKTKLWSQRIYHLSISPNSYTAEQVANWAFDSQYLAFFSTVKELDLRVIFRTMHEMNGGRYPRSSNPEAFKKARIHVRELSRTAGLDKTHILFDMSVNARDLPAKGGKPSQTATFIHCEPAQKTKLKCPSFEDYYPWDDYVDLMGFTFYNRGKGNSNRRWGSPDKIVNNPTRNTLQRIKQFNKPIFIDEVATSAVNYTGDYQYTKSIQVYETDQSMKDAWILQLKDFLLREKQIVGAIYFNVDLTKGLQYKIIWELDRALIDLAKNKFYQSFWDLYGASQLQLQSVLELFGLQEIQLNKQSFYLTPRIISKINEIENLTATKYPTNWEKTSFYSELSQIPTNNASFNKAIQILNKAYQQ